MIKGNRNATLFLTTCPRKLTWIGKGCCALFGVVVVLSYTPKTPPNHYYHVLKLVSKQNFEVGQRKTLTTQEYFDGGCGGVWAEVAVLDA